MTIIFLVHLSLYDIPLLIYDVMYDITTIPYGTQLSRYRTLTIYNVFFEQNKMAEEGIRNTTTGDSVGVSCFYSNKGPS